VNHDFSLKSAQTLAADIGLSFRATKERLTANDFENSRSTFGIRFVTYDNLAHGMSMEEMDDLHPWIVALLPRLSVG